MKITRHAKKRIKQRLSGREDYFSEALEKGLRPKDVSGNFRKYLDGLSRKSRHSVVVYKNFVFLFDPNGNSLITTFSIPSKFHKITKKIEKRTEVLKSIK